MYIIPVVELEIGRVIGLTLQETKSQYISNVEKHCKSKQGTNRYPVKISIEV